MAVRRKKKKAERKWKRYGFPLLWQHFWIVMSVQIVGLYNKKETYMAKRKSSLKTQLEDEKKPLQEIKDYEGIHQDTEVH